MNGYNWVKFETLIGYVFEKVVHDDHHDAIEFYLSEYDKKPLFILTHIQDCCELVYIESIVGDLSDLEKSPILMSELSTNEDDVDQEYEHVTWTFIKFATLKGYIDIRYYGTSNGYYGESADLYILS